MSPQSDVQFERTCCITGGTGFVGTHLIRLLSSNPRNKIKVLTRQPRPLNSLFPNVSAIEGDLLLPDTIINFLDEGCLLINLSFLSDLQDNVSATHNLLAAAAEKACTRIIHCSTAVVVGNTPEDLVDENTPCIPASPYERIKLETERMVAQAELVGTEKVILRPTAVFGAGGANVYKLLRDIDRSSALLNSIRLSLYSQRTLNLVSVHNVIGALEYLALTEAPVDGHIFIVSDDEFQENNYSYVARLYARVAHRGQSIVEIPVPEWILKKILSLMGRTNTNPSRRYSCRKLSSLGFTKVVDFPSAISEYIQRDLRNSRP